MPSGAKHAVSSSATRASQVVSEKPQSSFALQLLKRIPKLRFIRETFDQGTGRLAVTVRRSGSKILQEWVYDLFGQRRKEAALRKLEQLKKRRRFPRTILLQRIR